MTLSFELNLSKKELEIKFNKIQDIQIIIYRKNH